MTSYAIHAQGLTRRFGDIIAVNDLSLSVEVGEVFLCTHNLVEAQRLCDRGAVMEQGHLVAIGTPLELAREIGMEQRYTLTVAANQLEVARATIDRIAAVERARTVDGELSVIIDDRETVPDILAALVTANVRVYAITPQQTSLEDIYLAIHQRKEEAS